MSYPDLPIACNPQALNAQAWEAHQMTGRQLFQHVLEAPEDRVDGYTFRFPATMFPSVAAFVEGERRCCPFFTFTIQVPPAEAAIILQISGSPDAMVLLAAEMLTQKAS